MRTVKAKSLVHPGSQKEVNNCIFQAFIDAFNSGNDVNFEDGTLTIGIKNNYKNFKSKK